MKKFSEMSTKQKIMVTVVAVIVIGFIGDAMGWWEMTSMIGGGGEGAA